MQKHFKYRIRMQESTENPGVWKKEKGANARQKVKVKGAG